MSILRNFGREKCRGRGVFDERRAQKFSKSPRRQIGEQSFVDEGERKFNAQQTFQIVKEANVNILTKK